MIIKEQQLFYYLNGSGEMSKLIRNKDWSTTALGAPDTWPGSLRTSVNILLNSQFPMFIWWGKELITIYNDAYRAIAGEKHPQLLGKSGREGWVEIWDNLSPLVDNVFCGTSTWSEDQLLLVNRHGYVEEAYFTFSYSPIMDERGAVGGLFCACIETTEKVLATRHIQESERNLRNTIIQSPVAICILKGPSFVVEIANTKMYELWGRGASNLANKPIFEGLPEAKEQGLEELLQHVYTTGETFTASERPVVLPRYGKLETVYLNFVYEPFREGDGSITGIIAVATDVTEQVQLRQQIEDVVVQRTQELAQANVALKISNEELQRSNASLEEFAYAASHDMKEPIRKIHFFSDRLKQQLQHQLTEEQSRLFGRMEHAASRMSALIDDLLTYSHVTRGLSSVEEIDLNTKLHNVLEDLELEIQEKGAKVSIDPLPTIKGQRRQIQQLFQNLIGNALKYSKADEAPRVHVGSRKVKGAEVAIPEGVDAAKQYYHIWVKDNGIGFRQEDAVRIFNVFTRLHGNAEYRGTGVGLSIAQRVVENHGGRIWAESEPGNGATFNILLPVGE